MSTVRSENLTARSSVPALQEDRCCDGSGIGVRFPFGAESFLIAEAPSVAVGHTKPTKHSVRGCFFLGGGIKRSGSKLMINLNLSSYFNKQWSHTSTNA